MIDALFLCPSAWHDREEVDGEEVTKAALKQHGWVRPPSLQMPGTRTYQGRQLVHCLLDSADSIGEVVSLVPGECVGALGDVVAATYDYANPVTHEVPEQVIDHPALSYIDPETEEEVVYQEAWQEVIPAYTYETYPVLVPEHREVHVELDPVHLLNWQTDDVDENGVATRPTALRLHTFAGREWYL